MFKSREVRYAAKDGDLSSNKMYNIFAIKYSPFRNSFIIVSKLKKKYRDLVLKFFCFVFWFAVISLRTIYKYAWKQLCDDDRNQCLVVVNNNSKLA